jgi:hypothetical protein
MYRIVGVDIVKLFLFFILFPISILFAQNQETIAILDFQTQNSIAANQARYVSGVLGKQFNATGNFIVLEKWMIDTVLAEQGFNSNHACASEQCLIAIGHLLTVKKVLGGTILKKGGYVELSALMIDVDANALVNSATVTVPVAQKRITEQNVTALFRALMTKPAAKRNNPPANSQNMVSSAKADVSISPPKKPAHETSLLKKKGFWMTASACVVGAAAVSVYYLLFASKGMGSAPDTGISLGDAPSHSQ